MTETTELLKRLEAGEPFEQYCTCGGYAWRLNGRDPLSPHMDWCPQKPEFDARVAPLKSEG